MTDKRLQTLRPFLTLPSLWEDEDWPAVFSPNTGLDMYETENEVVIKAAVPGVPADNIEVTFEDGVLRVTGRYEEKEEERQKKKVVYREERASSFNYSARVTRPVDAGKIQADVDNGVVTIMLPLSEASKPRKIAVNARKK